MVILDVNAYGVTVMQTKEKDTGKTLCNRIHFPADLNIFME